MRVRFYPVAVVVNLLGAEYVVDAGQDHEEEAQEEGEAKAEGAQAEGGGR